VSRIESCLAGLADKHRKALVTFITGGDPDPASTVPALHALTAGGADIIELGIPFSDPEAEGPSIQRSSERALAHNVTLASCLDMVREFRQTNTTTPIVLMGYLNSVLAMGVESFAERAADAGVDGLIMVNLPPEEALPLKQALEQRGLNLIFLIAPTTTADRASRIIALGSGFLYYVTLKGITGADHLDVDSVRERVVQLRQEASVPVMVGFGIKDAASARALALHADGVVVGSALVNTMAAVAQFEARNQALTAQVAELRAAVDAAAAQ
jgi:tryptophan synthase alpha chain